MIFETSQGFLALAFLVAFPSLSEALPIESRQFDELDGSDLEARQGVLSCHPVSIDQIKTLPAWGKIEQFAKDNYGEGGVNIVANPSEYPDRQLQACMKGGKIPVQFSAKPDCTTSRKDIEGKSIGTTSEIEYTTKTGISQTSSWTVTHSSSLTAGVKFGVTVGIPGIGDATAETYMETTIQNERSTSFEGKNEHEETVTMKYSNKDGDQCKMQLVTETCIADARGRAPVVASGFVWFNYEDKRPPKSGGDAHYKYSIDIDSLLSEEERTTYIEFQGPMNSRSSTTYDNNCSKAKAAGKKPGVKKSLTPKKPAVPGKGKPAPGKPAPKPKAVPGKATPKTKPVAPKGKPAANAPKPAPKGKPAPKPAAKPAGQASRRR